MAGGVILGDWTHRRGDAGGSRALAAEVAGAKPRIAWTWTPPHGGRVDQVRVLGELVFVATLEPEGALAKVAPGWEHAVIYALDAARGVVVAQCTLADPVPVAAMVLEGATLHLVATRPGEPVFWYALRVPDLVPLHRRLVEVEGDGRQADVLDAWASPDGGLWLEIESAPGPSQGSLRSFTFLPSAPGAVPTSVGADREPRPSSPEALAQPRDACAAGRTLFVPSHGADQAPSLSRLEPDGEAADPWARAEVQGGGSTLHPIAAEGVVSALALGQVEGSDRTQVQSLFLDTATGVVRHTSRVEEVDLRDHHHRARESARPPAAGGAADDAGDELVTTRVARRRNGELILQRCGPGSSCSDIVCALPDGAITSFTVGAGRSYALDLVLGDAIVAHRPPKDGRVIVGAFAVAEDGGWLGRRTTSLWSLELPCAGSACTVYAGAGHVIVRSRESLSAIRVG